MVCSAAIGALFRVVISGKVGHSNLKNITIGQDVKMSFLVDPTQETRIVEGHPVLDGIAPYPICTEDFSMKVNGLSYFHLGVPPVPAGPPPAGTPPPSTLYFSLMSSRPIFDGAWVSWLPDAASDVPLEVHGTWTGGVKAAYNGVFGFTSEQFTFPSINIAEAVGSYTPSGGKATFKIWRDWVANNVLSWEITGMTITKAI